MSDSPARLLIVEDNPTDEMILRRALVDEGLNVSIRVAQDGDEAMRILESCAAQEAPHLVVIDINLPKRSGIDVLRKCRFTPLLAETKTLVFTSSDEPSDHSRAELLGVNLYLRKPSQLEDFAMAAKAIRKLLGLVNVESAA